MDFVLNPDLNKIDWSQLTRLFEIVGWGHRPPEDIRKSFETGSYRLFIFDHEKIIGFGRTVDDGKYYALIVDVVVDPEYQGHGFGRTIVTTLKDQLTDYKFITLSSAVGKAGFYKKLGWQKQSSAFIWPVNDKQRKEHCELEE